MAYELAANLPLGIQRSRARHEPNGLRVLHVLEATLGGTRRYLEDIAATTLDASIVQGLVYGTSRADDGFHHLLERARSAGWFLWPVDAMRRPVNFLGDTLSVALVGRAIREFKPTVMHVHSAKGGGIGRIAMLTHGFQRPRVVYSPHALPNRLGRSYMSAERMLGAITDRFIAVSESERREIIDEGIAQSGRVDVVYPRIDAAYYCPREQGEARRELRLPQGVPIVLGIGRLAPQKDPLSFVSAIARLRATMPTAIGIWVGDGELRNQVEAAARRLRLGEGLQIAGWISDVRPHIAACDVLLSTSRYESFGYAVAESFAMERPAVASRVTGTVDVFYPAAESLLYPAGALDEAVTRLTRLLNDKALRKELGGLGRSSMIENFSGAAMYRALSSSYRAALS